MRGSDCVVGGLNGAVGWGCGRLGKVMGCSGGMMGRTGGGWCEAWDGGGRPGRTDRWPVEAGGDLRNLLEG